MKNIIIYGGSVGCMALAKELCKNQDLKIILINPSKSWGGYFGGINVNGVNFDVGMNLFEFTSFCSESSDIMDYNPDIKSDSGKYSKMIESFVKKEIETHVVDTPLIYWNSAYTKDFYISNSLDILSNLEKDKRRLIIKDLEDLVSEKNKLHASNKNLMPELFYKESYFNVSLINHGFKFHSIFIEPLIKKILNISTQDFPAILHRIPWAPLFYPETLLNHFMGNLSKRIQVSQFEYPNKENFSVIVDKLLKSISNVDNIQLIMDKVVNLNYIENVVTLESEIKLNFSHLVIGVDITEYHKILGNEETLEEFDKASLIFLFIRLPKSEVEMDFSVLFILDQLIPFYRITNQTNLKNQQTVDYVDFIIEFNSDYLDDKIGLNTELKNLIESHLISMGVIEVFNPIIFEIKYFKNAINLPTFNNINHFNQLKSRISDRDNVYYIGNINNLFANSFNDNLTQALLISKKINL